MPALQAKPIGAEEVLRLLQEARDTGKFFEYKTPTSSNINLVRLCFSTNGALGVVVDDTNAFRLIGTYLKHNLEQVINEGTTFTFHDGAVLTVSDVCPTKPLSINVES